MRKKKTLWVFFLPKKKTHQRCQGEKQRGSEANPNIFDVSAALLRAVSGLLQVCKLHKVNLTSFQDLLLSSYTKDVWHDITAFFLQKGKESDVFLMLAKVSWTSLDKKKNKGICVPCFARKAQGCQGKGKQKQGNRFC